MTTGIIELNENKNLVINTLGKKDNLAILPKYITDFDLKENDYIIYSYGGIYQYVIILGKPTIVEGITKKDIPILEQIQDNIYEGKYNVYFKENLFHKVYMCGKYICYHSIDGTNNFKENNIDTVKHLRFKKFITNKIK